MQPLEAEDVIDFDFACLPADLSDDSGALMDAMETETSALNNLWASPNDRLSKNDIRQHFPKMLIAAVNSGCINHIQNFIHAFLAPECECVVFHRCAPALGFSNVVRLHGPSHYAHYVIGMYAMCPDLSMRLVAHHIVGGAGAELGSTTLIHAELSLTKVAILPNQLWMPPPTALVELYNAANLQELQLTLRVIIERGPVEDSDGHPNIKQLRKERSDAGDTTGSKTETTSASGPPCRVSRRFEPFMSTMATLLPEPIPARFRVQYKAQFDQQNKIVALQVSLEQLPTAPARTGKQS